MNIQIELKNSQKSNQHQPSRLDDCTEASKLIVCILNDMKIPIIPYSSKTHAGQKFDLSNQRECEINFIPFSKSLKPLRFILSPCLMQNSLIPASPHLCCAVLCSVYSVLYLIKFVHQLMICLLLTVVCADIVTRHSA